MNNSFSMLDTLSNFQINPLAPDMVKDVQAANLQFLKLARAQAESSTGAVMGFSMAETKSLLRMSEKGLNLCATVHSLIFVPTFSVTRYTSDAPWNFYTLAGTYTQIVSTILNDYRYFAPNYITSNMELLRTIDSRHQDGLVKYVVSGGFRVRNNNEKFWVSVFNNCISEQFNYANLKLQSFINITE
jgi:hypothetical protein